MPAPDRRGCGRQLLLLLCALVSALGLVACGRPGLQRPLNVVATIAPLADWARQVGQQHVAVTQLVPVGVDPATYVPTETDRRAVAEADVLLLNGLGLEPWLTALLEQGHTPQLVALDLGMFVGSAARSGRTVIRAPLQPDADEALDPSARSRELITVVPPSYSSYLWLDPGPEMAQRSVRLIAETFARVDPDRLGSYRRNAERYTGELENLDTWIWRQVRSWPRVQVGTRRMLIAQMPERTWYYFAERYGLALSGTTEDRLDPALLADSARFVDRSVSPAASAEPDALPPDGVLDPLGDDSYIELIRRNVDTITRGMQRAARRLPDSPGAQLEQP